MWTLNVKMPNPTNVVALPGIVCLPVWVIYLTWLQTEMFEMIFYKYCFSCEEIRFEQSLLCAYIILETHWKNEHKSKKQLQNSWIGQIGCRNTLPQRKHVIFYFLLGKVAYFYLVTIKLPQDNKKKNKKVFRKFYIYTHLLKNSIM